MTKASLMRFLFLISCTIAGIFFLFRQVQVQPAQASPGYLRTSGNKIVDSSGATVGLSGLNWFGFETDTNAPHGLWARNWQDMLDQVQQLGYNTLRIPFSNAMLNPGVMPTSIDYHLNPDLRSLSSLQVLDKIIEGAGARGIRVILDNHRASSGGGPEENGLWYTAAYPETRWIADWQMLASRYFGNPTVVGMDLRNEPFNACWGCGDINIDWRLAAERAGNAILEINPDLLVIVEGVMVYDNQYYWWGGNLMGAADYPVRLDIPDRLVYSTHDYPESVYSQPWFDHPDYPNNLPGVWDSYWGYLLNDNTAPILIGEFGVKYLTLKDQQWLHTLHAYIQGKGISWTFWSLNPNSGDTGGLLLDDWTTVHPEKQAVLSQIQYPFGSIVPAPSALQTIWLGLIIKE
jgi:endoglucanase